MKNYTFNMIEIRKKKSISQKEMASKLNVSQQTVSDWERERTQPNFDKLVEIATVLDVTLDELIEFKKVHKKTSNEYVSMMNEDQDE